MKYKYSVYITFILFLISNSGIAQVSSSDSSARYKIIAAGPEYEKSRFYQWLWGKNYRKEWTTPISFPVLKLDTVKGGMIAYEEGGGHQSKSLHITLKGDKEYALRSIDKKIAIIPENFRNTFIEDIANDQISMSHPYGALAVPLMAEAAGLFHTYPRYFYLPPQPILDTLNSKYPGEVYLFEQRPKGDWSDASNLGGFKKYEGSDDLLEELYEDNTNKVDQVAFVKARLFDMLIGDYDRHWDQWKWGVVDSGEQKVYIPVPTDRDQVFATYDGVLLKAVIGAAGMRYLQPFDYTIRDVRTLSSERRMIDRFFTNEVTLQQWQEQAHILQRLLTDSIIEASVRQMPPEIFAIRGNEIIAKLKSRRDHLSEEAAKYYTFLAEEVEIVGSEKDEYFEVNRLNNDETSVKLYRSEKGGTKGAPFYSRSFKTGETREIRLFGLSGEDVYRINGDVSSGINIRIIGGDERDSVINNSGIKIHVYDDEENVFQGAHIKYHLSDSTEHTYNYDTYIIDKKGFKPALGYSHDDPFYAGLGYRAINYKWGKFPYASNQSAGVKYSLSQNAFSLFYKGIFTAAVGRWDLLLNAGYDFIKWLNFYGIGNETVLTTTSHDYNRARTRQFTGNLGLQRNFGKNTITLSGFYESVGIINDKDRFLAQNIAQPAVFNTNHYAGIQLNYKLAVLNDSIAPTAGIYFNANASHYQNLTRSSDVFQKYSGVAQVYIPLISKFSLAVRGSAATVSGTPYFYELPRIGGADDLRGYRRERFYGKTAFTNSNELRYITDLRSYLMNGKIGLSVFYDQGRVWQPGESSGTWHADYGAGLLLAPFNMVLTNIAYGISKESRQVKLRVIKAF